MKSLSLHSLGLLKGFPSGPSPYLKGPVWGAVYDHMLFNLDKSTYRIDSGGCEVTEKITDRTLIAMHYFLGMDRSDIEKIGEIIKKVMTHYQELQTLDTSQVNALEKA